MIIDLTQGKKQPTEQELKVECGTFITTVRDNESLSDLFYHVGYGNIPSSIHLSNDTVLAWSKNLKFRSFFDRDMTTFKGVPIVIDSNMTINSAWLFSHEPILASGESDKSDNG
jgi:hypothetical protein